MEIRERKVQKIVDNSAFNDRFKFVFSVNDNIICERFFKINGFDYDAINSEKMKDLFVGNKDYQYGTIISMIVNDLKSKSRVYTWYTTDSPVKLTGFKEGEEVIYAVYNNKEEQVIQTELDENGEPEIVNPFDVTFKFSFQMAQKSTDNGSGRPLFSDYRSVYEAIWDGSVYPKFIRNSVDLTNAYGQKDKDLTMMNFVQSLIYRMTYDKKDLVYYIIREICEAATFEENVPSTTQKKQKMTSYLVYGDKKYPMDDFDKEYIDGWRKSVEKKTRDYYAGRI